MARCNERRENLVPRGGRERRLGLEQVSAIQLKGITKRFGSVVANDDIDLALDRGEILALLGENGSGKTTLMNMLSGIYFPDEGQICVGGKEVTIRSPKDAYALGIGMIHQHFKLVDVLTAAENIVLGLEGKGRLDIRKAAAAEVQGHQRKVRLRHRPGQEGLRHVGVREADGGDRQGALPGGGHPDPG